MRRFIFLDPGGRRWPRVRVAFLFLVAALLLGGALFFQSILETPFLRIPASLKELKDQLRGRQVPSEITGQIPTVRPPDWVKFKRLADGTTKPAGRLLRRSPLTDPASGRPEVRLAFYADTTAALSSLAAHADQLTHLAVERFTIVADAEARPALHEAEASPIDAFAAQRGLGLLCQLSNLAEDGIRLAEPVEQLITGPEEERKKFLEDLVGRLVAQKAAGLLLDIEQTDPAKGDALAALCVELGQALRFAGKELWVQVPMGEELQFFPLDRVAPAADRLVAVLHGENGSTDPAGPLASPEWFEGWLDTVLGYGEPAQWVAVLGAGGFDWQEGAPEGAERAQALSFADAMARADYAGLDDLRKEGWRAEAPSFNSHFSFLDSAGARHQVWFLDAATFFNQLQLVRRRALGGFGIDRLGGEDPGVWPALLLPAAPTAEQLSPLGRIAPTDEITGVGRGAVVGINMETFPGTRRVEMGADGRMAFTYTDFPTYVTLFREGAPLGGKRVALTFDDGPDPDYTPRILDLLKRENLKATFFIIGSRAELHPDLVQRIIAEGHLLGNHSYSHPNLSTTAGAQTRIELNATQRLIEMLTGRSTLLFRPPYNADAAPARIEDVRPLNLAQSLGYLVALEDIDTLDWERDGADAMLERVRAARQAGGTIVLMHDGGGDREQTLEALPRVIEYLRGRGDDIVPLNGLIGKTYDAVMPPLSGSGPRFARWMSAAGFRFLHAFESFTWGILLVATFLVVGRTLVILWLALRYRAPVEDPAFAPPVSVVIAAFNEAKVIAATLRSVLDSDHPGELEVLVIDDGSTDGTGLIVADLAAHDPRLRLVTQPNAGKAAALERGFAEARHEAIVLLDADTQFRPDTIRRLVAPLRDPKVGAVSGHARVGNPHSLIARCQALEYICGFNLDRRAYAVWDCITVVPGAISALRRSAVRAVGGLSHDTLAEDTDLTLALHRGDWKVAYTPRAVALTEAPETFRALAKQRFRWAFGTMQCLWKHRDLLFSARRPALGWFSLPGVWFFQILLVAATPFVDLSLLLSLLLGNGMAVLPYFTIYLLVDVVLAIAACLMEREPLRRAFTIVPLRFIYRVLLSYVVWKAISRALRGALVGWGKLERTAGVGAGVEKLPVPAKP